MPSTARPETSSTRLAEPFLELEVGLERLELLEVAVPQIETFRSAIGERRERRALFVRWLDAGGAWGIGECSCRSDPYFNGEFLAGAVAVIESFVFPHLPRQGRVRDVVRVLARLRGWSFTAAAVLDAVSDLLRRRSEADPVDAWPGPKIERVPVGISLGLLDDAESALERVGRAVREGYRRVKLKVGPTTDPAALAEVRRAHPALALGFDANGSFDEADFELLAELAELEPVMLEQPFEPGRLDLCAELKRRVPGLRICLDESLTGLGSLITAHRLGALDEVNLKPGRVGGTIAAVRILEYCQRHCLPAWVGGMFETGVGRIRNLRVAACLPTAAAHDLSPSRRYFETDLIRRPIEMDGDGYVDLSGEGPVEVDEEVLERLLIERRTLVK